MSYPPNQPPVPPPPPPPPGRPDRKGDQPLWPARQPGPYGAPPESPGVPYGAPYGAPPTWSQSRSGALIALGLLNILFALGCGCFTGCGTMFLTATGSGAAVSPEIREAIEKSFREAEATQRAEARTPEERQRIERTWEIMRKHDGAGLLLESIGVVTRSPSGQMLQVLGMVAVGLHLGFLISGILLLARVRAARWFTIFVALAAIVVYLLMAWQWAATMNAVSDHVAPKVEAIIQEEGLDQSPETYADIPKVLKTMGTMAGVAFGLSACLYPLIALLIASLSSGIKRDLGLIPPAHQPY